MSQFCYWQIFKDADFYILLGFGCIALIILLYTSTQFLQILKLYRHIDYKVRLIYLFCLLWALLYVVKIAFLLVEYAVNLKHAEQGSDMFGVSQMFCVIDTMPTFFLLSLLILIPYFWLKNITDFLERMRRDQRKDRIIIRFFTFYIYLRIALYLSLFVTQLAFKDQSVVSSLCETIIFTILCQVFLSFSLLCYGLLKMFRNFSSLNVHDKQEKRKFINEYMIMILCSFTRFTIDFYFIIHENTDMEGGNCFDYRRDDYVYTMMYVVLGELLMHLMPVLTVLFIYRIDFRVVREESLLTSGKGEQKGGRRKISEEFFK